MSDRIEVFPLEALQLDDELQMRVEMDHGYCDDLLDLFDEENPVWPAELPPAEACFDGTDLWVWDGRHRLHTAREAGCVNVRVRVRDGTRLDAAWLACGANKSHGLRRKAGDVEKSILAACKIKPEIQWNQSALARHVGCSQKYAGEVLSRNGLGNTNRARGKNNPPSESLSIPGIDKDKTCSKLPEREPGCDDGDFEDIQASGGGGAALPEPVVEEDEHQGESDSSAAHSFGVDELDMPIPSQAGADAFEVRGLLSTARHLISELEKLVDRIGNHPGGELLRVNYLQPIRKGSGGKQTEVLQAVDLENLKRELNHWRPYAAVCPLCGDKPKASCKACCGLPYLTKTAWERIPEAKRQLAMSQEAEAVA